MCVFRRWKCVERLNNATLEQWSRCGAVLQTSIGTHVLERQTTSVSPSFQHYKLDNVRETK